jgi:membrane associated rhomboid family serine protease
MGLYDRDYQRGNNYGNQPGFHVGGQTSMTTKLVIVMFIFYVIQLFTEPKQPRSGLDDGWFTDTLRLYPDVYMRPWQLFQLITYGFLHDIDDFRHIIFNMLGLWFFGRAVEERYGSREFLTFFLVAVVTAGLVWIVGETIANLGIVSLPPMLGASGGVTAVLILFALNFPHATVLFMFFIPMPMWLLAIGIVLWDAFGAIQRSGGVAFTAHLGGAAFALLYYQFGWRLERFLPGAGLWKQLRPKPKLRVVDSEDPDADADADAARLDAILKKIAEKGQDSLTYGERRFLERASKEFQNKRK